MKKFVCIFLSLVVIFAIVGCSRVKSIANDINWIVFDGVPARDN